MKIYQAMARTDEGDIILGEAIEYEGELWLVPNWISEPERGSLKPERIIRVRGATWKRQGGSPDYSSDCAIPIAVLEGRALPPPESDIFVIVRPEIECGSPGGLQ